MGSGMKDRASLSKPGISAEDGQLETRKPADFSKSRQPAVAPLAPPQAGRGRKPRIPETPPPPPSPPRLEDYEPIIGRAQLDELRVLARGMHNKTAKMVNSTAVGGGVAEMLNSLVPLLNELAINTHWEILTGGNDFFEVTKAFHNALQGGEYSLTKSAQDIFLLTGEQ